MSTNKYFFLSYSRKDSPIADEMKQKLRERDIEYWIDTEHIRSGEKWSPAIDRALKNAAGIVLLITLNSRDSTWVTYEWAYASGFTESENVRRDAQHEKLILPVIFEGDPRDVLHPRLYGQQYHDFRDKDQRQWDKLLDDLEQVTSQQQMPESVQRAVDGLNAGNAGDRQESVKSLKENNNPASILALATHGLNSDYEDTREGAIRALIDKTKRIKDESIIPEVQKVLETDESPQMRSLAAIVLGNIGTPRSALVLEMAARSSDDPGVREIVFISIGSIPAGVPIDSSILTHALKDIDSRVVGAAAAAFARRGDQTGVPYIAEALDRNEKDENLRRSLLYALAEYGNAGLETLVAYLRSHRHEHRRQEVAMVMARIHTAEALAILQSWRNEEDYRAVKSAIDDAIQAIELALVERSKSSGAKS